MGETERRKFYCVGSGKGTSAVGEGSRRESGGKAERKKEGENFKSIDGGGEEYSWVLEAQGEFLYVCER